MARYVSGLFIVMMFVGCFQLSGLALTNEDIYSQFQFNFITPGARAIALGGAFIGLADDATAVETNPAGLTQLLDPEISAEFKYITYTTEQIYENFSYDTDITMKEFDDSVVSVPFMSYVYPFKRAVFSVYRQESVNYKSSYRTSPLICIPGFIQVPTNPGIRDVILPFDSSVDLNVINYGIGAAIRLTDSLSLAISPRLSRMKIQSHSAHFDSTPVYDDNIFSDDNVLWETILDDDDNELSINVGLMWQPHSKVSIGAVYRSGPQFTATLKNGRGSLDIINDPDEAEFTLNVPALFGIGIAFRATDFLMFTLDEVHIRYKDLMEDFDAIQGGVYVDKYDFFIDNATEIHVGAEYLLILGEKILAIRAGAYNNPDHTIRYSATDIGYGNPNIPIRMRHLFPGGEDQIHFTGGLGLVLNDRFQIDTAVNIADKRKQFSFSSVYRFDGGKKKARVRKPAQTRVSVPTLVEEVRPSVTFTVVKFEKTLEIQSITTDTPGVSDVNVTIKQAGKRVFIITAALEQGEETFTTDVQIKIGAQDFMVETMDEKAQVNVLSEKGKSLEVMVTFGE